MSEKYRIEFDIIFNPNNKEECVWVEKKNLVEGFTYCDYLKRGSKVLTLDTLTPSNLDHRTQ